MGLDQTDSQIKNANYRTVWIFSFETTRKATFYALNYTSSLLPEIWVCHNCAAEDSGLPGCSRVSRDQWRILIRQSGLAERYNDAFCTLPLDMNSGPGFATATGNIPRHSNVMWLTLLTKDNTLKEPRTPAILQWRKSIRFPTTVNIILWSHNFI